MSSKGPYDLFQSSENFQELDSFLEIHDLWRKTIPSDKHSLFRCISEHVYNTQSLYFRVKNHYLKFLSNNTNDSKFSITSDYLDSKRKNYQDLKVLSTLFFCKFQIVQLDNSLSISDLKYSKRFIPIVQTESDHFDLVYPRSFRQNLAFIQSLIYTILYKNVFQIDIPFSLKDFTLQSIRETYFLKQDVYEFSHLERCLNSFYFEDLILRNWKYDDQSQVLPDYDNRKLTSYFVGDVVKVFSPNTDNKPYYLAKIVKLFVTPGMHEVLAPNRGTELVDIGHLKPTTDKENQFDDDTFEMHSSSAHLVSANISSNSSIFQKSLSCTLSPNDSFQVQNPIATNEALSNEESESIISRQNKNTQENINEIPPGFEEINIIPTSSKSLVDNGSLVFKSFESKLDNLSIKAPKHKYGPQSAAVKHKFTQDSQLDSKVSISGLKPFEQISENAHSQIKKLQFKLNSSSNFLSPKFSIHPEGSDLPEEKFILQYFYNLGVQYQLMRSHGSNWKDVLPNSCPPLYHDNNYHSTNPMVPVLFRDSAGVYFSQDVLLPNYYYDMTMLPFIQGYLPSMPYGMQSEPLVIQNYGKYLKDDHDIGKVNQFGEFSSSNTHEHEIAEKSSLLYNSKIEDDVYNSKSGNLDSSTLQNIQIFNQKNPQDNPQTDPNSWPQPGGNKNVDNITWMNESQRPAYSNALKKGTSSKQPNYTAERTIYASTTMNDQQFSKTNSKRMASNADSNPLAPLQK